MSGERTLGEYAAQMSLRLECALAQGRFDNATRRYFPRLSRAAVALDIPNPNGATAGAVKKRLLRVCQRLHEDKRANLAVPMSKFEIWQADTVVRAMGVLKDLLDSGAWGTAASCVPDWPLGPQDGDTAGSTQRSRLSAHLKWAETKLSSLRAERQQYGRGARANLAAEIAEWEQYVADEHEAQAQQPGPSRSNWNGAGPSNGAASGDRNPPRHRSGGDSEDARRRAEQEAEERAERQRQRREAARAAAEAAARRAQRRAEEQERARAAAADEANAAAARDRANPGMPPVAPARALSNGIEQMDHIPWERTLFNPFGTPEELPIDLEVEFCRAARTVIRGFLDAQAAGDETTQVRWLKFWRLFGQIMLRNPPRGGRRGYNVLPARFAAFSRGDFRVLVDWWEFDRAKLPTSPRQADRSRDKLVDKAVRYAERFCFSKAVRLLTSNGVADSTDPRIQAQMDAKFPDRKSPMPGSLDNFAPFQPYTSIEMEHYTAAAVKSQPRGAGSGPDGMRPEYFHALSRKWQGYPESEAAELFSRFVGIYAANSLPPWYYYIATASLLIPIIKEQPANPAQAPDARPVQMGNVELRIVGRAVSNAHEERLRSWFEPQQLGTTTKGGLECLVHMTRMHLEANPTHVIVKLDIRNMFNEIKRAEIIRIFESQPELRDMVPYLFAVHSPASPVFYADGTRAGKPCGEGTRQGSAEAGTAACAAIQPALRAADTELKARGGFARADFDDTYLGGPPADVAAALDRFDAAIALVGAELQRAKSAARCGAACELPADFPVPLGVAKRPDGTIIGFGIKVAGIPLGDAAFMGAALDTKATKLEAKFTQVANQLAPRNQFQLWAVLRCCLRPTGDYFARLLFPDDAAPLMHRIDAAVRQVKELSFSQDLSADGPLGELGAELHDRQSQLPKRGHGLGLRSLYKKSQSVDFVAALLDTLPRLVDRSSDGGEVTEQGLANWLAPVIGAGAFDQGNEKRRLAVFLQNGGETAAHFRACWGTAVLRAGAVPHDGAQPTDNPLEWPIEMAGLDAGPQFRLMKKPQRALTLACEAHEYTVLDAEFRALDQTNAVLAELRSQWLNHDRFSLLWSCCLPSRAYCNDNPTFQEGVAASLGLPSPVCRPYVGLPIQTAARGTHRLDAYGKKLGALPLPGAARDYRHDELVYAAAADLQYNGVPAVVEPRNLVNAWMTPAGHAAMSQAEAQRPLQGCIPDLLTTEEPGEGGGAPVRRLYDLKVINHCPSRYGPNQTDRCGPVEKRAAAIPTEYVNKLRNKDRAYHNTAPGEQGPMEAALQSLGGCTGLVGGFYGEMSKSVDQLAKTAARQGAERQAAKWALDNTAISYLRSVLTNKIRTNWAMALFRGNAQVKISNVRWVRGASGGANAGDGADRDGRWRQKREQYRYAQDEYRGPQMGGFGGRHCK
jgi:hypothetical protein